VERPDPEPEPDPEPGVEIALSADPNSVSEAGDVINYTYTVSNTGEVTLTGVTVTDDKLGGIALDASQLAPGGTASGTATYTITQADVDAGVDIVSTAIVTTDQLVTDSDSATVIIDAPEAPAPGVTISPAEQDGRGWGGETVTYEFTVQNTGDVADTYDVSTASEWASSVTPASVTLEPGASASVTVTHTVPGSVSPGDFDEGTVQVLSADTGASATAGFTTTARVSAMAITPGTRSATAAPGETVQYTYTISNTGTEDDVYDLATISEWDSSVSPDSIDLAKGDSVDVTVTHTVPANAHDDDRDSGSLIVDLQTDASTAATVTFSTTVELEPEPSPPVIDLFQVTDSSNPAWARVNVDWAVSDQDGDLYTVTVQMLIDGTIVDSATYSVSGYEASGSCQLRHRSRRGHVYDIILIVTDSMGNTTTQTQSINL